VKVGFTPIRLRDYVELHIRANPGTDRAEFTQRLKHAVDAYRRGVRCRCGARIWIIGSAEAGLACFTCITGEATPDHDYEISVNGGDAAT
jgi:hypothetical protein